MRLLYFTTVHPAYLRQFYARDPGLIHRTYSEQQEALDRDRFGWIGVWPRALSPLGHDVMQVILNATSLQSAWLEEKHQLVQGGLEEIALAQVRAFAPDLLWYDHEDEPLLARLRAETPSIRLVLGWAGSWIADGRTWRGTDLVLSCAPESVEALRQRGMSAEFLPHGFDESVMNGLDDRATRYDVTFIGQIVAGHPLHVHRERLLDAVRQEVNLTMFSPSARAGWWDRPRAQARRALHAGVQGLLKMGMPKDLLHGVPALRHATTWTTPPRGPLPRGLQRALQPGRFGRDLYQTLRDSKITLNVESASTTRHSSNMRLFEATGVGTCLLTDRTEGLAELFEPEREVATYRDARECVERIRWLLAHPAEREAIARAGQERTLRDHTYALRAKRLDQIVRKALG